MSVAGARERAASARRAATPRAISRHDPRAGPRGSYDGTIFSSDVRVAVTATSSPRVGHHRPNTTAGLERRVRREGPPDRPALDTRSTKGSGVRTVGVRGRRAGRGRDGSACPALGVSRPVGPNLTWQKPSGPRSTHSASPTTAGRSLSRHRSPGPPDQPGRCRSRAAARRRARPRAGRGRGAEPAGAGAPLVRAGGGLVVGGARDEGNQLRPHARPGGFGYLRGVCVEIMSALLLPSAAPTPAPLSRMTGNRAELAPSTFVRGYLVV